MKAAKRFMIRDGVARQLIASHAIELMESRVLLSGYSLHALAASGPTNAAGAFPNIGLAVDAQGDLFGTTSSGGVCGYGTVFEIPRGSSTVTPLASFNGIDGAAPTGNLIVDADGNLYGLTGRTSTDLFEGTVFELAHGSSTPATLGFFPNNGDDGALARDSSGDLFAIPYIDGTVYEIAVGSSTATAVAAFHSPSGQFVADGQGNLYGVSAPGGAPGAVLKLANGANATTTLFGFPAGTFVGSGGLISDGKGSFFGTVSSGVSTAIYRLGEDGTGYTTLASFGNNVSAAVVSAVDGSGNLYGVTYNLVPNSANTFYLGTVFELVHGSSTVTTVASFDPATLETPSGTLPSASPLVLTPDGNLYGSIGNRGSYNAGTIFEVVPGTPTVATVATFSNTTGDEPISPPAPDGQGDLFGTTDSGGTYGFGEVFEVAAGTSDIVPLAEFQSDAVPSGQLAIDAKGDLFGATEYGGINGTGSIFEVASGASTISTLASFGPRAWEPMSGVVIDDKGDLFGTTYLTTTGNAGSIFELPAGSSNIAILALFDTNGNNGFSPLGQIALDSHGNLFGTTHGGGSTGFGTVFELTAGSSSITTLASFDASLSNWDYADAHFTDAGGIAVDASGNVYGTAAFGDGTAPWGNYSDDNGGIFEIPAGSSTLNVLDAFDGTNGRTPLGQIAMDASGNLYGTTQLGGAEGNGTLCELPAGSSTIVSLASFAPISNLPASANGVTRDSTGNLYAATGTAQWVISEASSIPFADMLTGTPTADNITLSQDADHHSIDWSINGAAPSLLPINDPNGLTINGNGGNETITLDYSNGNPLPATLHLNGTFSINGLQGADPLAGRTLDIGTSTVYLTYGSPSNDPIFAIRQYLQNGYNHGAWNGTPANTIDGAITSSAAQNYTARTTGVGFADWADGQGVDTVPNTIELKYTLDGDANLDGQVNSADLQILLFNPNRPGSWDQGDFNYDGQVNSADLQSLLFMLNTRLTGQVTPLAMAATPAATTGTSAAKSKSEPLTNQVPAIKTTGSPTAVNQQNAVKPAGKKRH